MDDSTLLSDCYTTSPRKSRQGSDCSMSSQRLEEVVASLMRPIKDLKQNFDMDFNGLLEEYLTEAGLRHISNGNNEVPRPNFSEVALLLQQSAYIYSKKVDYLWSTVIAIAETIGSSSNITNETDETEKSTTQRVRRKRKHQEATDFEPILLEEATNINVKEIADPKPLPVLPKTFIQFEQRVISENDIRLFDLSKNPIGVMADFRVNWNTDQFGTLCDDLDFCIASSEPVQISTTLLDRCLTSPLDSGNNSDGTENRSTPILGPVLPEQSVFSPEVPEIVAAEPLMVPNPLMKRKTNINEVRRPKTKLSKFDISVHFTESLKNVKILDEPFELPYEMIQSNIDRRINKRKKFRQLINEANMGDRIFHIQYHDQGMIKWKTKENYKSLKILTTTWDEDFDFFHPSTIRKNSTIFDENRLDTALDNADSDSDDDGDAFLYNPNQHTAFEPNIARKMMAEAEEHLHPESCEQSDVSKRVEAWHASIREKLIIAEKRKDFDIYKYTDKVLDTFKVKNKQDCLIHFSDIIQEKPKEDIARYFLATLMLANTSNIEISNVDSSRCSDFDLKLVSVDHHFNENDLPF